MRSLVFHCRNCGTGVVDRDRVCSSCGYDVTQGRRIQFVPFNPISPTNKMVASALELNPETIRNFKQFETNGVKDEKEATYLLTEVRKVLERYKSTLSTRAGIDFQEYSILWFYCSWALHIKIDREQRATDLLTQIDGEAGHFTSSYSQASNAKISQLLTSFVSLFELRNILSQFFTAHGLSLTVVDDTKEWIRFASCFLKLVINSELKTGSNLRNIESIFFQRIKETPIHKDQFVEISVPRFEDLSGHINIVIKFTNGDMFAVAIILPGWI